MYTKADKKSRKKREFKSPVLSFQIAVPQFHLDYRQPVILFFDGLKKEFDGRFRLITFVLYLKTLTK